jgi:hypothetical protein
MRGNHGLDYVDPHLFDRSGPTCGAVCKKRQFPIKYGAVAESSLAQSAIDQVLVGADQ